MKHLFTKKLLTVAAIFASVSLFSAEEQPQEKVMDQGHGINEHQMMGAYSAPARFDVKGSWDVFMTASFIYWQAKQTNLDLGYVYFDAVGGSQVKADYVANYDFDYLPGFKVGLGFNFLHDNWSVFCEYTRLHGDSDKTIENPNTTAPASHIVPLFTTAGSGFTGVKGTYDVRVDLVDFQLARPYYSGTKLTIEPHFGLRGGWLKQHANSFNYFGTTDEEAFYNHSSSWLVGPRAGFNGYWHLGEGFRICGNASAGLYYQHMKATVVSYDNIVTAPTSISDWAAHTTNSIVPSAEMGLGLAWGMYLGDHDFHLDLSALYDFVYFWNQGSIRALYEEMNSSRHVITNPGDFVMQGLTINARLDF